MTAKSIKLLIVEDEAPLAKVLDEKFSRENFEVNIAADGEEALALARSFSPDVVILDLILPKKSGLDVLREMKSSPDLKGIVVIVVSNLSGDEEIKTALQLGAVDYFVKADHPIKEIVEKVKAHII